MDCDEFIGALTGRGLRRIVAFFEVLENEEEDVGTAREEVEPRPSSLFRCRLLLFTCTPTASTLAS